MKGPASQPVLLSALGLERRHGQRWDRSSRVAILGGLLHRFGGYARTYTRLTQCRPWLYQNNAVCLPWSYHVAWSLRFLTWDRRCLAIFLLHTFYIEPFLCSFLAFHLYCHALFHDPTRLTFWETLGSQLEESLLGWAVTPFTLPGLNRAGYL